MSIENIGFKDRSVLNKSEWVYDVAGGGDYIEATFLIPRHQR